MSQEIPNLNAGEVRDMAEMTNPDGSVFRPQRTTRGGVARPEIPIDATPPPRQGDEAGQAAQDRRIQTAIRQQSVLFMVIPGARVHSIATGVDIMGEGEVTLADVGNWPVMQALINANIVSAINAETVQQRQGTRPGPGRDRFRIAERHPRKGHRFSLLGLHGPIPGGSWVTLSDFPHGEPPEPSRPAVDAHVSSHGSPVARRDATAARAGTTRRDVFLDRVKQGVIVDTKAGKPVPADPDPEPHARSAAA